jgi:hypothetical protein
MELKILLFLVKKSDGRKWLKRLKSTFAIAFAEATVIKESYGG